MLFEHIVLYNLCVYDVYMREKFLWVVNIALVFVILIVVLHLYGVAFPSVGKVRALLDGEEPACGVRYGADFSFLDMSVCCREASQQLGCVHKNEVISGTRYDYVCYTGHGDVAVYLLNAKAHNLCSSVVRMP